MNEKKLKILISAGGSGGHILPAKQLAVKLLEINKNIDLLFAAKDLKNKSYFKKDNIFKFVEISSATIKSKSLFSIFKSFFFIFLGMCQSAYLFFKFRPNVVVGFGSFHTLPVLLVSKLLKIPIVLFEPNCVLGKTSKFFSQDAKIVAFQFDQMVKNKKVKKHIVNMLPWSGKYKIVPKKEAIERFGLKQDVFTFFVFGGSLGSSFINRMVSNALALLKDKSFQVIHIAGTEIEKQKLESIYKKNKIKHFVSTFLQEMYLGYCSCDFVISRSGASTISEIIYFEKASILIPFPLSSNSHQEQNATFLQEKVNCSIKLLQKDVKVHIICDILSDILTDKTKKKQMEEAIDKYKNSKNQLSKKKDFAHLVYNLATKDKKS
jgi:UDP-N-acetylglucosamine--N-acetylmuramyl-(pentapeptide) pyrophosphoryl-undecaprenol N-acetylglucosamine transferase